MDLAGIPISMARTTNGHLPKRIAGILLAAGSSTRFGGTKQLAKIDSGSTMVERVVATLRGSRLHDIVIVVGNKSDEVGERAGRRDDRVRIVLNHKFKTGLSSSLKVGVGAANESDAIVIVLADQPLVTSQLIDAIIDRYEKTGNPIVASVSGDLVSPPALFDRSIYEELQALKGDVGARPVILRHPDFERVEVEGRTLLDVDTRTDIRRARSLISGPKKRARRAPAASERGRARPS